MFQTLSPRAGDAIHPVLLGRMWLVRLEHFIPELYPELVGAFPFSQY
jgi:hypothetical protein